ncbi:hypothetical protein [Thalassospira sp.]|uniref:hypothetical protein n=1 Tax=Thalassospira sp. TaxID=1912094 RepID=UPI002732BE1E|nr:hypothetical protein [Thalassospira sp.]MDP2699940.1 hypothetical protein [Thalassospira sp.]
MKTKHLLTIAALAAIATIAITDPALAQGIDLGGSSGDTKWYSFIVEGLKLISEGGGAIIVVLLGLGLCVWGGWGAVTGRLDAQQALTRVIGGIIGVASPTIAEQMLSFIS